MTMSDAESAMQPSLDALGSARVAKNLCWWVILLAILAQLFTFAVVRFGGVLDASMSVYDATLPNLPVDSPQATHPAERYGGDAVTLADRWHTVLRWVVPGAKFVGVAFAVLLVLTLLFAVQISLVGRLAGAAGFVGAFFWAVILLAILLPWQQIWSGDVATGALYSNLTVVVEETGKVRTQWGTAVSGWFEPAVYYARFVAFPVVALLVWLVVHLRFAVGVRRSKEVPAAVTQPFRPESPSEPL